MVGERSLITCSLGAIILNGCLGKEMNKRRVHIDLKNTNHHNNNNDNVTSYYDAKRMETLKMIWNIFLESRVYNLPLPK